jgi:hypothetical protein
VVFLFEGLIWWIHDYRYEIHEALRAKEREYRKHQKAVLAKTRQLQEEIRSNAGATNRRMPLQQGAANDATPGIDQPLSNASDRDQDVAFESEYFDASESDQR